MNKRNISTIFLLSLALIAPMAGVFGRGGGRGGYGRGGYGRGYGYGGDWIAPAIVGTALTSAAIAASNQPRTVVVNADDTNQVRKLQRENRDLRKQIDRQERQIRRLERKLEIA